MSKKLKDENIFFYELSELVNWDLLLSKSIGKPINASHVFLSNDYKQYSFTPDVIDFFNLLLKDLKSNNEFSGDSLSHHVDGLIINHPKLGSRIIEFDEEQHFTPARGDSMKHLSKILSSSYLSYYTMICQDLHYLESEVFKKHRLKGKLYKMPKSFLEFVNWLTESNEKQSEYIGKKSGFDFLGGRIAQRAYYDSLRDTAHLSPKNAGLIFPLRFPKRKFEEITNTKFSKIPSSKMKDIIKDILLRDYDIDLTI